MEVPQQVFIDWTNNLNYMFEHNLKIFLLVLPNN